VMMDERMRGHVHDGFKEKNKVSIKGERQA